ncbi:MAG: hypothetical protein NWQ54_09010 [Paraglaciecola sp.]|uniref:hypothetical protein n=1 Tax=Pseudomonadati TaxID=3379134 RepID=UPI00273FCD7A|nr:hypothetical protein [Paraglaciecola sp.]MDP5029973.1 hypothetical protein [Paraglaciecola sp.]MDP5041204.1 hypothetical protein [Paraglaciecola sp.]MDP5131013.1 hypothetical protein [Paraglaciecola sp.]
MNKEQQLQTEGKVVIESLSPLVKWQYNDFHQVMLAEFSVDKQQQVMTTLEQILPCQWDAKSIKKAPDEVKHLAGFFAKLVKNQKLLSTDYLTQPKIMVAWWPWGHGATVSVRLFLTNTSEYQPKQGLLQRLTAIFS